MTIHRYTPFAFGLHTLCDLKSVSMLSGLLYLLIVSSLLPIVPVRAETQTSSVGSNVSCPVGAEPFGIAFDSSNGYMYVADEGSNAVSVLAAPCNVIDTIILGPVGFPNDFYLVFDQVNGYVYVSEGNPSSVIIIQNTTIIANITR